MSINKPNDQTRSPVRKVLDICGIIILISVMGYYSNKTVQGYLGQQVIDATGLESITLKEALQVAKRSNKLLLADMSAIWCPACRELDEQVFSNERVKTQHKQDFVYVRIEYESPEGKSFMQNYQVTGFSTLLVLNTRAEKLIQLPIDYEPLSFLATLEKVVNNRR
jgi:thiol:disulfide interchange protein